MPDISKAPAKSITCGPGNRYKAHLGYAQRQCVNDHVHQAVLPYRVFRVDRAVWLTWLDTYDQRVHDQMSAEATF